MVLIDGENSNEFQPVERVFTEVTVDHASPFPSVFRSTGIEELLEL
jgi:hypothetical protein|tara:strand:- start:54 stop:191 length:138 start_codon:yes stop_codon:yes gene_type:complete